MRNTMSTWRRWAPALVLALVASACGTRLTNSEIENAAYGSSSAGSSADATGPGSGDGTASAASSDATDTTIAGESGGASGTGASSGAAGGGATGEPTGAPIVLGQIGTFTGITGPSFIGLRYSAQAWVASVNAHGGINGHPVKLISRDDGSDGSKGLSEVKDMVENQHVIAFIASSLTTSGQSVHGYLEQHRIPVVGGDGYDQLWHESPMLFPQSAFINNLHYATAAASVQTGKKAFALMWCAEVAACGAAVPYWESSVNKLGAKVVYKAQVSIAAPDYTAQCLQAQQNGADVLWLGVDSATITRMANSCARQNYHPAVVAAAASLDTAFPANPNLQGLRGATQEFPWFLTSGSPAMEEYGDMMKRYAPNAQLQPSTSQGWTAAKLFEKAAASTIKAGDAPTTDAILRGLWSIKNETLGGLTPPITFVQNQPAMRGTCAYVIGIDNGKWIAPNGLELTCGTP